VATDARERILEAACDLIASDGIDDVRIARVANRARASTALVHHYFSTREELLAEALTHSFETAGSDRFAAAPEGEDATRGLARAIDACLPLPGAQERDWTLWVELWLRAVRDESMRPLAADLYRRYHEWIAAAIEVGIRSGEFRTEREVGEIADLAVAVIDGAGVRALIRDPALGVERARALVGELLCDELGLEPGALASPEPAR
jgi:AcrR family transcriptional regulator